MTETLLQKALVIMGSLIQDIVKWHSALVTDWSDLFAEDLVTGNLQLLHIWFFMFLFSGLDASQPCYVTTFTAVFRQTVAAHF